MGEKRDCELYIVMAENFKLDGGACFGVVPKSIWEKNYPPDENNMLPVCCRCLLIKDRDRLILIDSGIGNKQSGKFIEYLYLFGDTSLKKSFQQHGFTFSDVTDVIFTHLHFDHCGGAIIKQPDEEYMLCFPNASYWCSKNQWEWAINPNIREGASYFRENLLPMFESGKLHFIEDEIQFSDSVFLKIYNGHTDGQIIPHINHKEKTIVFMADFIPSVSHIPYAYVASYDTRPLISMKEKEEFLDIALNNNYILFFEHDYLNEACTLTYDEKKGIKAGQAGNLSKFI